jgi:predicted acylesterase/phospholipase RssA
MRRPMPHVRSVARCTIVLAMMLVCGAACRIEKLGQGPLSKRAERPVPLPQGVEPNEVVDATDAELQVDPLGPLDASEVTRIYQDRRAEILREVREREDKAKKDALGKPFRQKQHNILLLSGGGAFGAYPAGVLCGWSQSGLAPEKGGRPEFDVVTGVSSGALIAPLAFLGSEYDAQLQTLYTTVQNDDIFKFRRQIRALFAESVADNAPLRAKIDSTMTYGVMVKIAEAHAKGRRLYVGSTNLDTKRLVVWDLGAIATKGTEEARQLIVQAILASAAIPGFFPSVRFNVTIDGVPYEELHVDGVISRGMFFRPPYFPPDQTEVVGPTVLAGSNLFALVAGKYYADPEGVKQRTFNVAGASVSNLMYQASRGDLYRFFNYSTLCGMDYFSTAIPADLKTTNSSTNFDKCEMTKMFNAGYATGQRGAFSPTTKPDPKSEAKPPKPYSYADGTPIPFKEPNEGWRNTPPGLSSGERGRNRASLELTVRKEPPPKDRPQGTDQEKTPPAVAK